jgi:thiosulfate dehydrogenase
MSRRPAPILKPVTRLLALAVLCLPVMAAETESSTARGGRLYDKWWAENKAAKPAGAHPAYPVKGGKYADETSWRCKECHGWDYKGKDGAYAKGGHASGIKGISAAAGRDPAAIAALLRDKTHGYTEAQLSARDVGDLALFVSRGQGNLAKHVVDNKVRGDGAKGEAYYNTLCAGCHGEDGKKVKDGPPLGSVADNGAEMMHKLANGQPGEAMPSLRALDAQIAADIAVHLTKLPK